MAFTITGTTIGDDKVVHRLGVIVEKGTDFAPVWPDIHEMFLTSVRSEFRTQGKKSGGWKPLNTEYAKWKRKRYGNKPILRATDRMWKSLTDPGDADHLFVPAKSAMAFGSMDQKAPWHQYGVPENNLPARPMIVFDKELRLNVLKKLQAHILSVQDYRFNGTRITR